MNQTRRKRPQGPSRKRKRGQTGMSVIPRPPPIPSTGVTRDVRLRFLSNAAFGAQVTFQNLLDTILFASAAAVAYDVFEGVRVNRVECWASAVLGNAVTCIVSFDGTSVGSQGDQKVHSDTSMGIEPAYVSARPDPRTQAGQFQASTSANAFFLDIPTGCVVDVSMSFRQPVSGSAIASQNVPAGAVVGAMAYRGLDGKAIATTVLPPQGVFYAI